MIYLDYTVDKIKKSAKKNFYENGFNGTRITDIAKDAEVSKSLLHYYFRTKEHLFKIVVNDSIDMIIKQVSPILTKDVGLFELIDHFIYSILILFKDNKKILSFIINEYNQNFNTIKTSLKPLTLFFSEFENKIIQQSQKENFKLIDSKHLIITIISICEWETIGVNIFNLETHINESSNSINITEVKERIHEIVLKSLLK